MIKLKSDVLSKYDLEIAFDSGKINKLKDNQNKRIEVRSWFVTDSKFGEYHTLYIISKDSKAYKTSSTKFLIEFLNMVKDIDEYKSCLAIQCVEIENKMYCRNVGLVSRYNDNLTINRWINSQYKNIEI